jgi:hypothetical protein
VTPEPDPLDVLHRRLPPVAEVAVASLALMLSSGIYLAAQLPGNPPMAPVVALVAAGAGLTVVAMAMLARIRPFAWGTFFAVAKWAFAAYLVIAAILAFVFVYDGTPAATLSILVVSLAVFAVDVPTVIGFTVARYQATG